MAKQTSLILVVHHFNVLICGPHTVGINAIRFETNFYHWTLLILMESYLLLEDTFSETHFL